jgi:hypothetical protein
MKHIISVGISVALLTGVCRGQDNTNLALTKTLSEKNESVIAQLNTREYYLERRNKLNSTAWMLLGVGTVLTIGGSLQYENAIHLHDRNLNEEIGAAVLTVGGTAMVIASIPCFVSSRMYNKKLMNMTANLKIESYQSPASIKQYPAIGLRISL